MLYVHLLLVADDLGNAEANPHFLRRRLLTVGASDEAIACLLSELQDADLIRIYVGPEGAKRYAHIPRFRQRLRSYKRAHPRPPVNIECNEISKLLETCQTNDGHLSDTRGRREGKRREEKGRKTKAKPPTPFAVPPAPNRISPETWQAWCQFKGRKLTSIAYTRQCNFLAKQPDPNACIDQSLRNSWTGLFEAGRKAGKSQSEKRADVARAIFGDKGNDRTEPIDITHESDSRSMD